MTFYINILNDKDDSFEAFNPDFQACEKVHDWKNHVPDEFADNWSQLTDREKIIIYKMAKIQADNEEWD